MPTAENDAPITGHDDWIYDLGTPRMYTARGGWNVLCECGSPLGETGDEHDALKAAWREHVARVIPPGKKDA